MNWSTVSYERILEVTDKDLDVIKHSLGEVYTGAKSVQGYKVISEGDFAGIANAFTIIDDWSNYYHKHRDIQDSKLEELSRENDHLVGENKRLNNELNRLTDEYNKQTELVGKLQGKLEMMNEVIKAKDNNSNMVQVDLVEMIEKLETIAGSYESAIKAAEHKAAMKTFNKRVASGEVKPAKRTDVSDEDIIENVKKGVSAYKIAQSVGMTQQAILYRIKKLKEADLLE